MFATAHLMYLLKYCLSTLLLSFIQSEVKEIGDDNGIIITLLILLTSYVVLVYTLCWTYVYTNNNVINRCADHVPPTVYTG